MATKKTKKTQSFSAIDDQIAAFLGGELDSLEGEQDALALWKILEQDPHARARYDAMVYALRAFAKQTGVKSFHQAEEDALWPLVMGGVSEDAKRRSGLSKQALRHLAVPDLVSSITRALSGYSQQSHKTIDDVVFESPITGAQKPQELEFSIASVGGEVSLRLYRNDEFEVRCSVADNEVTSNVGQDVDNWDAISSALNELSSVTAELLGEQALVNGRIAIREGRAEVHLNPLNIVANKT